MAHAPRRTRAADRSSCKLRANCHPIHHAIYSNRITRDLEPLELVEIRVPLPRGTRFRLELTASNANGTERFTRTLRRGKVRHQGGLYRWRTALPGRQAAQR